MKAITCESLSGNRLWTGEEDDLLRRLYSEAPGVESIAGFFPGRTAAGIKQRARKLGMRNFTRRIRPGEVEVILELKSSGVSTREIGRRLGHGEPTIWRVLSRNGLVKPRKPWDDPADSELRRLVGLGWSDAEIAAELSRDRHSVSLRRSRLGLPSFASTGRRTDHQRRKIAEATRAQMERKGYGSFGELRGRVFREFAASYGLPETLSRMSVVVLIDLVKHGPSTARAVAERLGLPWNRLGKTFFVNPLKDGSRRANTAFGELAEAGLVLAHRTRPAWLYFPTPLALDLMSEASEKAQGEST